jgi:hypothetical protein
MNAGVSVDRIVEVLGYAPAPIVTASNDGAAITGAIGGKAKSVVAALNPKLENGSLAPNYDGGPFAAWTETKLNVNGDEKTAVLSSAPYLGSFDWVSGKTEAAGVRVYQAKDLFELNTATPPSTSSQGVKYIRVQPKDDTVPNVFNLFVACNRYEKKTTSPYTDKCIRINSEQPYIYDNNIDFNNPLAILDGLEFLLSNGNAETFSQPGIPITLNQGSNTITSDAGAVTVAYGVDTKTYIDQKFAALSAALLGG